jgi:hypothetical protein
MKRWLGYGLLGLVAYVVFLLSQLPATLLMDSIAQRVPGFAVQDIRGSVFNGAAQGVRLRGAPIESLSWQWRFLPLFLGRVEYQIGMVDPELRVSGNVAVGLDRQLRITDLTGSLPLAKLMALLGYAPLAISGQVHIDAASLHLVATGLPRAATGALRLLGTRITLGRPLELGDFSAEFSTRDQDIVGNVKDQGGPLELTGALTLTPDGRYRFNGQVGIREQSNHELGQALSILGRPGADGKWKLNFTGTLQV